MDEQILKWRSEIDQCDTKIIKLILYRLTIVKKIQKRKKNLKLPLRDKGREKQMYQKHLRSRSQIQVKLKLKILTQILKLTRDLSK